MKPLAVSLTLHTLALSLTLMHSCGIAPGSKAKGHTDTTHIVPKSGKLPPVDVTLAPGVHKATGKQDCKGGKWYGGVGMIYHPLGDGRISQVAIGYPAWRIGLKAGDYLINPPEIRGEVGTKLQLLARRGTAVFVVNLVREKICTE